MSTAWLIQTNGDVLGTTRRFLADLWPRVGIEGFVIPVYHDRRYTVEPTLVEDPGQLLAADPFAPVVIENSARRVLHVSDERPDGRFAVVLRSCEARALRILGLDGRVNLDRWTILGVDCLPSFSTGDLGWRIERAGGVQKLTSEALQFARHGGIAPYRFRRGCQMCISPEPEDVQLCLCLYGLPVNEFILVKAQDEGISRQLHLKEITDGPAPDSVVIANERALTTLKRRRMGVRQRGILAIPENLPGDAVSLITWIQNCAPCQKCLDACPIYVGELQAILSGEAIMSEPVGKWLASCLACGMCEDACPRGIPLTAIKTRIARQVNDWIIMT